MIRKRNKNNKTKRRRPGYGLSRLTNYTNFENKNITFLDPHKYITLKYIDVVTISLATVTGVSQVYNLNSLFDPDRTGAGHQPYGFDQLSALYNRYRVLHTHWKVVFSPSSLSYALTVGPLNGLLAASVTNEATFETAAESPRMRTFIQGASGLSHIEAGSISLNSLTGVTLTEYLADDRMEAIVTASPSEVMILEIGVFNPGGSTISINLTVEITYMSDLHDPILLAGST